MMHMRLYIYIYINMRINRFQFIIIYAAKDNYDIYLYINI